MMMTSIDADDLVEVLLAVADELQRPATNRIGAASATRLGIANVVAHVAATPTVFPRLANPGATADRSPRRPNGASATENAFGAGSPNSPTCSRRAKIAARLEPDSFPPFP